MARSKPKSFSATIRKNVAIVKARTDAVFKQSAQEVAELANLPTAQGGNMRVDTSFLRNSQTANLNAPTSGPSIKGVDPQGNPNDVALVIANATVKDVIWIGWSASYARYREYKDGFVEGAAKKWKSIVDGNVARAVREIK